jgi:hypothetical protein
LRLRDISILKVSHFNCIEHHQDKNKFQED